MTGYAKARTPPPSGVGFDGLEGLVSAYPARKRDLRWLATKKAVA